jgi:molybdopterin converting factor subunit 1
MLHCFTETDYAVGGMSLFMRVLFFAQTKDAAGASELEMKISGTVGVEELWEKLAAVQPKLAALRKTTRLARNGEYANAGTKFSDEDEVALIPPVSGG